MDLVINIPKDNSQEELEGGYRIRRMAIDLNIPLITNARLASSFIDAVCDLGLKGLKIRQWSDYELTD